MRTSRISKDTSRLMMSASNPPRSTRASLSRFAHTTTPYKEEEEEDTPIDIEDSIPGPRKRKREVTTRTKTERSPRKTSKVKNKNETEIKEETTTSPVKERKVRKPARQVKNEDTGEVEIHPPNDWKEVYDVVMEMRTKGSAQNAAVDTMGCESLAQETVPPKVKRYHTLTALMLSSQTKDTTTAATMNRLYSELPPYEAGAPVGLNIENILAVDPVLLNELIWAVGFHNNKTKYIKATAEVLRDNWNSDIPDTIEGLMALPGVGPKMGYLCLSSAWGRTEGIGVDVHVHRITNLWGWNKTKGPEETRLALQAWLPKEKWHEINWMLVGFGQTICLPVGRKCGDCELGLRGLCKAAERSKVTVGRKLKAEKIKVDEDGNLLEEIEEVKVEEVSQVVPVNVDPKQEQPYIKNEILEDRLPALDETPNDEHHSGSPGHQETSKYFS